MYYSNYSDFLFFVIAECDMTIFLEIDYDCPDLRDKWFATQHVLVPTIKQQ